MKRRHLLSAVRGPSVTSWEDDGECPPGQDLAAGEDIEVAPPLQMRLGDRLAGDWIFRTRGGGPSC